MGIDTKKAGLFAVIVLLLVVCGWSAFTITHALSPVRVGVLMPLTGDVEVKEPLEWAKENINRHGGIGGRPLELVYRDTNQGDTKKMAEEFLSDDSVRIVIGPPTSADVYSLTPAFAAKKKILISPFASSGDLSRAFAKNGYFWRTAQGDVAQVKVMMSILKGRGASRVALLAEDSPYGKTFYDWTGFFAIESGISLTSIRQFREGDGGQEADVQSALADDPDYLIAACGPSDAAAIKRAIDRSGKKTRLFVTDSAVSPDLLTLLGPAAEGIEGTAPTADPATGFPVAYREKFGHAPTDFAAPIYDSLLLAAYTTARQDAVAFESPADSFRAVVYGNGTLTGWDAQGIREALREIRAGKQPAITGSSGPLDFDTVYGVDPLVAYYSHWTIGEGDYRTLEVISSEKTGTGTAKDVSASHSRATPARMLLPGNATTKYIPPAERTDFQAVIIGPSNGWSNYRHQSDALAVYTLLREAGVGDDHIVLMIYDDIPTLPENPIRGDVHNIPKGSNLRTAAEADYTGRNVTGQSFQNVMLGTRTATTPVVLESGTGTDVFVYIASHGAPGGIVFSDRDRLFNATDFTSMTDTMSRNGKYRQIVFMVDTCFGEGIAGNATAPGLLYFTGASATEPSLGAVYDTDIRQWLSDEFTDTTLDAIREKPDITFRELYVTTYDRVTGSHVRLLNSENFGNIDMPVREYLKP